MRHRILGGLSSDAQPVESLAHRPVVPLRPRPCQSGTLPLVPLRIHLQQRHPQRFVRHKFIRPYDDAPSLVNLALVTIGSVGDLLLKEACLDSRNDTAQRLNPLEVIVRLPLQPVGERLNGIGTAQRIYSVSDARFVGDNLLGAQCDGDGVFAGERQRLIHAVGVQGLGAAENRRQRLNRHPHDVDLRLLRGERATRRLGVEAQPPGAGVLRAKGVTHLLRPDTPGGAELGDLLQKVVVAVEEEGETGREGINVQPTLHGPARVLHPVGQGEGQFLRRRRTGLADVVAGDGDGIPLRQVLAAELDGVGHQPHRGLRREDVFFLGDVLLEDVVLDRAAEFVHRHTLLLGGGDVHGPGNRRRGINGHRGGYLVQGDAVEENLHIAQRGDGDATLAELPLRLWRIGVVAVERGQVEGHRETGLPLLQEILEASVGLLGGAESGEHAHRPQPAAVHRGMNPPGERILTGEAQLLTVVAVYVQRSIESLDRLAGGGDELLVPLGMPVEGFSERLLLPSLAGLLDSL